MLKRRKKKGRIWKCCLVTSLFRCRLLPSGGRRPWRKATPQQAAPVTGGRAVVLRARAVGWCGTGQEEEAAAVFGRAPNNCSSTVKHRLYTVVILFIKSVSLSPLSPSLTHVKLRVKLVFSTSPALATVGWSRRSSTKHILIILLALENNNFSYVKICLEYMYDPWTYNREQQNPKGD